MSNVLIFLGVWSVVALFVALLFGSMLRSPLGPVTPRPVEGERARSGGGAADGSTSAPPTVPGTFQISSSLVIRPGDEDARPGPVR